MCACIDICIYLYIYSSMHLYMGGIYISMYKQDTHDRLCSSKDTEKTNFILPVFHKKAFLGASWLKDKRRHRIRRSGCAERSQILAWFHNYFSPPRGKHVRKLGVIFSKKQRHYEGEEQVSVRNGNHSRAARRPRASPGVERLRPAQHHGRTKRNVGNEPAGGTRDGRSRGGRWDRGGAAAGRSAHAGCTRRLGTQRWLDAPEDRGAAEPRSCCRYLTTARSHGISRRTVRLSTRKGQRPPYGERSRRHVKRKSSWLERRKPDGRYDSSAFRTEPNGFLLSCPLPSLASLPCVSDTL